MQFDFNLITSECGKCVHAKLGSEYVCAGLEADCILTRNYIVRTTVEGSFECYGFRYATHRQSAVDVKLIGSSQSNGVAGEYYLRKTFAIEPVSFLQSAFKIWIV